MKRQTLVLVGGVITIMIISSVGGYVAGYYVEGMEHTNETVVNHYCYELIYESGVLISLKDNCGLVEFIEAVERMCDSRASFIRNNKRFMSEQTQNRITEALKAWEKAKDKLQEIRTAKDEIS